jgi:hypothetical protein
MKFLAKTLHLPFKKFIFFDKDPHGGFEGEPDDQKTKALNYLKHAAKQSLLLTESEAAALSDLVTRADMYEIFSAHRGLIPDNIVVNFLAEKPILIILNQIIERTRIGMKQHEGAEFLEIFKIVTAYHLRLIKNI